MTDADEPDDADGRGPSPGKRAYQRERRAWFLGLPEARGKAAAARALAACFRLTAAEARLLLRSLPPDGVPDDEPPDAPGIPDAAPFRAAPGGRAVLALPEANGRQDFAALLAELGLTAAEAGAVLRATRPRPADTGGAGRKVRIPRLADLDG